MALHEILGTDDRQGIFISGSYLPEFTQTQQPTDLVSKRMHPDNEIKELKTLEQFEAQEIAARGLSAILKSINPDR